MQDSQNQFLAEGTKRIKGRDAQRINILVARAVANAIRSTLGPKGMDKMIVDDLGDVTISNDGATILQEMAIEHPVGKMLVDIAKTQDSEVGDGTTTSVVLTGMLLEEAEELLDNSIHPSSIVNGYRMASKKALEILDEIAEKIDYKDKALLKNIAYTSMTGKSAESTKVLSDLVVEAISNVIEEKDGKIKVDVDSVKIEKKEGSSLEDSELIEGIVLDKEIVTGNMPRRIDEAKIALIDVALEIKGPETDTKVQITDPDQFQAFLDKEEKMIQDMVDKIKESGAKVLFCQKGIDDLAQHFLAKAGILATRRIKKSDMENLAKATGAKIVSRIKELSADDLGYAKEVFEQKVSDEEMIFVKGCKHPKAVTLLIRGGTSHVIEEAERAVVDAIGAVSSAIKSGKIVIGGGACEERLAGKLRDYAKEIGGREQLAIEGFANALEVVPKTLSETAGLNPLDMIVSLRNKHKMGEFNFGIDVMNGKLSDMRKANVVEPVNIKIQAISSASEVAQMILRIDDVIAGISKGNAGGPGGMPPGMGGMPGMM
jgi:archaeal chaperonin